MHRSIAKHAKMNVAKKRKALKDHPLRFWYKFLATFARSVNDWEFSVLS
jgi:hypothetical protein